MDQDDMIWLERRGFTPFVLTASGREVRGRDCAYSFSAARGLAFHARDPVLPEPPQGVAVGVSLGGAICNAHGFGRDAESAFHDLFTALVDAGDTIAADTLDAIMHPEDRHA